MPIQGWRGFFISDVRFPFTWRLAIWHPLGRWFKDQCISSLTPHSLWGEQDGESRRRHPSNLFSLWNSTAEPRGHLSALTPCDPWSLSGERMLAPGLVFFPSFALLVEMKPLTHTQLLMVDHLARASMKNAARCEN